MADLYVYYKVRAADAAGLAPRVRALQADVAARLGVTGGLKRRPEERDGLQTWMEVYPAMDAARVPDFAAALSAAADAAGLADVIAGPRHFETFIDLELPPCA
jgi:hypothetical protein